MYEIQHAGTSGTFRPAGEVCTIGMAVAAARSLQADGFEARIMRAGQIWLTHEEITAGIDELDDVVIL